MEALYITGHKERGFCGWVELHIQLSTNINALYYAH